MFWMKKTYTLYPRDQPARAILIIILPECSEFSPKNMFDLEKYQGILEVWKTTITINLLKQKFISRVFCEEKIK